MNIQKRDLHEANRTLYSRFPKIAKNATKWFNNPKISEAVFILLVIKELITVNAIKEGGYIKR